MNEMSVDPCAAPPTPAELAANPSLMERHTDFGAQTPGCELEDRDFEIGDPVRIAQDAIILDKERRQEGWTDKEFNDAGQRNTNYLPIDKRPVLEHNTKGMKGTLANGSYYSEERGCMMAPVEVAPDIFVYVDERKLERATPNTAQGGRTQLGGGGERLTAGEEAHLAKYREYTARETVARLDKKPFPTFSEWLTQTQEN